MTRRRIDYDPHDGTALAALLNIIVTARGTDDRLATAVDLFCAEGQSRRATNEAIVAALDAGHSARAIAVALGVTHAAITARARAARTGQIDTEATGEEDAAP